MDTKTGPESGGGNCHGFSLVELLVVTAMVLFLLVGILQIFTMQNRNSAFQQEIAYAQQNVRSALELMTREIRNTGYDPQNNGFEPITTASATTLRFFSNLSGDDEAGAPNDANEDVTYTINESEQLTRSGTVIADFVDSLQFGYVLSDSTTLDPPASALTADQRSQVRVIIVRLGIRTEDPDPNDGQYRVRTLVTRTRIRNLGFADQE